MALRRTQILIIGGGPAGASTAIALARKGHAVLLLERSRYDTMRVGESLAPHGNQLLKQLGIWPQFLAQAHLPSPGIVSAWGSDSLAENDFLFNPYGTGWHLDRQKFDALLATAAQEAGAEFGGGTRVTHCAQTTAGRWQVQAATESGLLEIEADFLVEATGRVTLPTPWRERVVYDHLVAVLSYQTQADPVAQTDQRLLLEAGRLGWWYSVPLPGSRSLTAFLTDAELLPRGEAALEEFWQEQLQTAPWTTQRCQRKANATPLRVVSANTSRRIHFTGLNYLAVGDSAMAFDPLSSQGIYKALASGLAAADAIAETVQGDTQALPHWAEATKRQFADYLENRLAYYQQEQRWPQSKFWRQRHTLPQH